MNALIVRDFKLALRSGGGFGLALVFFVIIVFFLPLGISPDKEVFTKMTPGLIWVSSLLSCLLSLDRIFALDYEDGSTGIWQVTVVDVVSYEDLYDFSFFLKDSTGSTYVGGNGFGEIAMQIVAGEEHGIDRSYQGDDEQLQKRADNMTEDDGAEYPVHFYDNDRDEKLSSGDQFIVYGTGNSANGPAEDDWTLEVQFDASGDVIGSQRLA